MSTVGDILLAIEGWAPAATAQSYDNVGLLVGSRHSEVTNVLTALDLVPAVIDEAIESGCELIVTHHPIMFSPIKTLNADTFEGSLITRLAKNGIALIAAHTNLDAAKNGVSFSLARTLGLVDVSFLEPLQGQTLKLVTFVPLTHFEVVRTALASAGAGEIGDYDSCGFGVVGNGNFRALPGATPFIGEVSDEVQRTDEVRYEVELPEWKLSAVLDALREAHPYEEVAFDVYSVKQSSMNFGMGAIGSLKSPETLEVFLNRVTSGLNTTAVRYAGNLNQEIYRVAVCGGSGSSLIPSAMGMGADVFVTGDITYHRYFEVLDYNGIPKMSLVDAGHYETEFMTERLIASYLQKEFDNVDFSPTRSRSSPISTFVPSK